MVTDADRHFGTVHPSSDTRSNRASTSNAVAAREDVPFHATALHDRAIDGSDDDLVGSLDTVLFDTMNCRALAFPGGRVVALPWGALQPNHCEGESDFRTATTAEQLKSAPQFEPGDEPWKVTPDPARVHELYAYHALQPDRHGVHDPVVPPS